MHQTANDDTKGSDTDPVSILYDMRDGQFETEVSAAKSRRVLMKIDAVVMPLIVISMTLAFLDKVPSSPIHTYILIKYIRLTIT